MLTIPYHIYTIISINIELIVVDFIMGTHQESADVDATIGTLCDSDRLRIITILSQEAYSATQLAEKMNLRLGEIMRHLELLSKAHLISEHSTTGAHTYKFDPQALEVLARQKLAKPSDYPDLVSFDLNHDQEKVVSNYTLPDGSLKMLPTKTKKIIAILEYISNSFEIERNYKEKEVNAILNRYHPDHTTLRRYLIDYGILEREKDGTRYWRMEM